MYIRLKNPPITAFSQETLSERPKNRGWDVSPLRWKAPRGQAPGGSLCCPAVPETPRNNACGESSVFFVEIKLCENQTLRRNFLRLPRHRADSADGSPGLPPFYSQIGGCRWNLPRSPDSPRRKRTRAVALSLWGDKGTLLMGVHSCPGTGLATLHLRGHVRILE